MDKYTPIDLNRIANSKGSFLSADPFPFLVLDDFIDADLAKELASDFPKKDDKRLFVYNNALEHKMALNDWNAYPSSTYRFLQFLNSSKVVNVLSELVGIQLFPDHGLHGGGWHLHESGGKLNPHLDYSIHPKLGLQRKLNLIIYLSESWEETWGGHLGFWSNNEQATSPRDLCQETSVLFNRAVLFDTTCDSWHGITREVDSPKGQTRNSIAVYYLAQPSSTAPTRSRALYAPTEDQMNDEGVLELIKKRADLRKSLDTYKT
ncbi:2OG-Fe(II) oxygenase [Roseivirga sp.]|uniref:2OG-Fe(II) oxygenase n=1 Tax=Roseivirga sp. TaxID=1964215 RepID=UPI003B8C6674